MQERERNLTKLSTIVGAALLVLLLLGAGLFFTYNNVLETVREECYDDLNNAARANTENIRNLFESRQLHIQSLATVLQTVDLADLESVQALLRAFRTGPVESRLAIIYPGNRVLRDDGLQGAALAEGSFAQVKAKGAHISSDLISTFDQSAKVIHIYAPVYNPEGSVVAVVYESIRLDVMQHFFTIDLYDSRAQLFVVDSRTGHFLLDNWHTSLPDSLKIFAHRLYYPGYTAQKFLADLQAGIPGNTIYRSEKVGEFLYTRYQPVGINSWQSIVSLRESDVLYRIQVQTRALWYLVILHVFVFSLFLSWVIYLHRREIKETEKRSHTDNNTGLDNRNAYMRFLAEYQTLAGQKLACIYIDLNGLHEMNNTHGHEAGDLMLRAVAEEIRRAFPHGKNYRMGGDEFLTLAFGLAEKLVQDKIAQIQLRLAEKNYFVSCGLEYDEQGRPLPELVEAADQKMLQAKKKYYSTFANRRQR